MPVLILMTFLLGNKINAFPFFQTVSLLYLTNFIAIPAAYKPLHSLIKQFFIFQPNNMFTLVDLPPFDSEIPIKPLVR